MELSTQPNDTTLIKIVYQKGDYFQFYEVADHLARRIHLHTAPADVLEGFQVPKDDQNESVDSDHPIV